MNPILRPILSLDQNWNHFRIHSLIKFGDQFWINVWIHCMIISGLIPEINPGQLPMQILITFWVYFCTNSDSHSEPMLDLTLIKCWLQFWCNSESNSGIILVPSSIRFVIPILIHSWAPFRCNSESNSGQFLNPIVRSILSLDQNWDQFRMHSWLNFGTSFGWISGFILGSFPDQFLEPNLVRFWRSYLAHSKFHSGQILISIRS